MSLNEMVTGTLSRYHQRSGEQTPDSLPEPNPNAVGDDGHKDGGVDEDVEVYTLSA